MVGVFRMVLSRVPLVVSLLMNRRRMRIILHNITKIMRIPNIFVAILFGNVENFFILDNITAPEPAAMPGYHECQSGGLTEKLFYRKNLL